MTEHLLELPDDGSVYWTDVPDKWRRCVPAYLGVDAANYRGIGLVLILFRRGKGGLVLRQVSVPIADHDLALSDSVFKAQIVQPMVSRL